MRLHIRYFFVLYIQIKLIIMVNIHSSIFRQSHHPFGQSGEGPNQPNKSWTIFLA